MATKRAPAATSARSKVRASSNQAGKSGEPRGGKSGKGGEASSSKSAKSGGPGSGKSGKGGEPGGGKSSKANAPGASERGGSGDEGTFEFVGIIQRIGTFFAVDVPASVSRGLGQRGHVHIAGTLNGVAPLRISLTPSGDGRHRLFLNGVTRREAGVGEGDRVTVRLALDADPRLPLPDDLAQLLRDEGVLEDFETLTTGLRNEIVRHVEAAVLPATRAKRFARAVEVALAARERRLDRG